MYVCMYVFDSALEYVSREFLSYSGGSLIYIRVPVAVEAYMLFFGYY